MRLNPQSRDCRELPGSRTTSALIAPSHATSVETCKMGYNVDAGLSQLNSDKDTEFHSTHMPSLLEPAGTASGSAALKPPQVSRTAPSDQEEDRSQSFCSHPEEQPVGDLCAELKETDALSSDESDPEMASQSAAGNSSIRGPRSDVVHQGKWARLKQAERTWRANMPSLRESDPQMSRCQDKVFNIFAAQCVVLRGRLHERLVRGRAQGHLDEAEKELEHVFRAVEDFFSTVSTPLAAFAEGEQQDEDEERLEDALCDGITGETATHQGLDCSVAPWPPELGISKKESCTSRRKYGKRLKEWTQSREQLAATETALNACLVKTHKDLNKACLRVKYGLHLLVHRQQGRRRALNLAEVVLDSILTRTGNLLRELSTRTQGPSCPLPVAFNEQTGDCEGYLFQAARLDQLVEALDTMDGSVACPSAGQ